MKKDFFIKLFIFFTNQLYACLNDLQHPDLKVEKSGLPYTQMQKLKEVYADIMSATTQNFRIQNESLYKLILQNKEILPKSAFLKIKPSENQDSAFIFFFLQDPIDFKNLYGLCPTNINTFLKISEKLDESTLSFFKEAKIFFDNAIFYKSLKDKYSCSWQACERTIQSTSKDCWNSKTYNLKEDVLFHNLLKIYVFLENIESDGKDSDDEFEEIHNFENELRIIKNHLKMENNCVDFYEQVDTLAQDKSLAQKLLNNEIFTEEELAMINF